MKKYLIIVLIFFTGCIGTDVLDDEVLESVTIQNGISSLKVGDRHQLTARYLNNIGQEEAVEVEWTSDNQEIISIDNTGLATAVNVGEAKIIATVRNASNEIIITASDTTITTPEVSLRETNLATVSSYALSGKATLTLLESGDLELLLGEDFNASSSLPGLYVYLSNNVNSTNEALEIGPVTQFNGTQTYTISAETDLFDYDYVLFFCKPFVVPVGNGKLNP